ncbi:protein of unknown function [Sterolibacterium denitrificans]|uniref:Uncharacterized protein n=1 Tax=Sterolibacterium denitrificans TaxID=157592 RepID=A0A7Z7MW69_9PROT|nr:protein of unknown function [Sterolibacterium denitrificans]
MSCDKKGGKEAHPSVSALRATRVSPPPSGRFLNSLRSDNETGKPRSTAAKLGETQGNGVLLNAWGLKSETPNLLEYIGGFVIPAKAGIQYVPGSPLSRGRRICIKRATLHQLTRRKAPRSVRRTVTPFIPLCAAERSWPRTGMSCFAVRA